MNKDMIYQKINYMLNNGFFASKYIELTNDVSLNDIPFEKREETIKYLEERAASIFNAILIGCQLFDDEERVIQFVDLASRTNHMSPDTLRFFLQRLNMTEQEACERLKNGFAVHFTTMKICNEIARKGVLRGFGNNAMFTQEEDAIIKYAEEIQKRNDPNAERNMQYLFRGWGTGATSYGSITNGFWMYHTPESLSFLFGNISLRDKNIAMNHVLNCISTLNEEDKKKVINTMSNIWDRLIGNEQEVGCVLIHRDAFDYEVDYYSDEYGKTIPVQRRPFSKTLNSIGNNDEKINKDLDARHLRFLKVPTIMELEKRKMETIHYNNGQKR